MEKIYAIKTKYMTKKTWKEEEYMDGEEVKTRRVCVEKQVLKTNCHGAHRKTIRAMIKAGKIRKSGNPFVEGGWAVQNYV